jgi:hypothetical protein
LPLFAPIKRRLFYFLKNGVCSNPLKMNRAAIEAGSSPNNLCLPALSGKDCSLLPGGGHY